MYYTLLLKSRVFAQNHSAVCKITGAELERTVTPTLCVQNGRADSWQMKKCAENLIPKAFCAKTVQTMLETTTTVSDLVMGRSHD